MTESNASVLYRMAQTDHIKLSSAVKHRTFGQTPCDYLYFKKGTRLYADRAICLNQGVQFWS